MRRNKINWCGHVTTFPRHRVYESQNIFPLHNPSMEDLFSYLRGAWITFYFTSHNLCPLKAANFIPWTSHNPDLLPCLLSSFSEPTYHGQISSRLSPKTLRFLDENCHWRNKTWLKFVPSYINVRSTVRKLHEFAFQFSIVSTQFRLPGEQ